ncbi:tetratricopeptide repeat protein [Pyxidicoccus trucidator]|uniref:tetratricopeptide repeat protein n=1 Tax=Pyxidicoccus trucidator TaxID=2709662 RepID=UPI0013DC5E97|nr:tetratricopeptide repeat protein [Pyxidicoccus trucidator]
MEEEHLPEATAMALLAARVVVVFADAEYFRRWYCLWELETLLKPHQDAREGRETQQREVLDSVVVAVTSPETVPAEMQLLPFPLGEVVTADEPGRLGAEVRARLSRVQRSLADRLRSTGLAPEAVQAELTTRPLLPSPNGLAGFRPLYPPSNRRAQSLRDAFKGRAEDLWRIHFALSAGTPDGRTGTALTGALAGVGGAGKTTLAWEYVHRFGPRYYPGGIFWVDADVGMDALEEQHHGILQVLSPQVPDLATCRKDKRRVVDELARALEEATRRGRVLYVVDNVPEPVPGTPPPALETWCPALGVVSALFTSRLRLQGRGLVSLPVDVLSRESAVALLLHGVDGANPADGGWGRIADWVGRLPLALALLNSGLWNKVLLPAELLAHLEAGPAEVLEEGWEQLRNVVPKGSLRGIVEAFRVSYEKLTPEAQRAARLVAHLDAEPIPTALLSALGPDAFSGGVRGELIARSFVSPVVGHGKGLDFFGFMHRVLADFLRGRSSEPEKEIQQLCAAISGLIAPDRERASTDWQLVMACRPHAERLCDYFSASTQGRWKSDDATLTAVGNLAMALLEMGDPSRAKALQEHILNVRRRLQGPGLSNGAENPDTLAAMGNLALTLRAMGEPAAARALQERVLSARERMLGPDHLDTLTALNNLAGTLGDQNELALAKELQERVLQTRRRLLGPDHSATLTAMNNLAGTLRSMREPESAWDLQVQVLKRRQRLLGVEHPDTLTALSNLAGSLGAMGHSEKARNLLERVLDGRRRVLGQEHPDTLTAMNNLALILAGLGERGDALLLQERVLEARSRILGTGNPRTLAARERLIETLCALGEPSDAQAVQVRILATRRRVLGTHHPATREAAQLLGLMTRRAS